MMRIKITLVTVSIVILMIFGSPIAVRPDLVNSLTPQQDTKLTIYTYNSLLADPGYEFDRAFESHAGLENGSVEVVLLEDAGSIVTRAAAEKDDPVADVLIGIDNVLITQARSQDILEAYQPEGTENLVEGLVEGLAPDYYLTPYDFGVISLWFIKERLQGEIDPSTFTLNDLKKEEFASQLLVENPQLSSPGLGFLLSTIALHGDSDTEIDGLISGSWQDYWRDLSQYARLTASWGDALSLFYTEEVGRPLMVSYTTSPAYGACLFDDTSTAAMLTNEEGTQWGWQQIEGIGLVKNAPHPDLAKDFIDWFISEELQSQIHQNQWVYPAHEDIPQPDCYDVAIDPDTITPLNDRIPQDMLDQYLDQWLTEWEVAWTEGPTGFLSISPAFLFGIIAIIPIIYKRRR